MKKTETVFVRSAKGVMTKLTVKTVVVWHLRLRIWISVRLIRFAMWIIGGVTEVENDIIER